MALEGMFPDDYSCINMFLSCVFRDPLALLDLLDSQVALDPRYHFLQFMAKLYWH